MMRHYLTRFGVFAAASVLLTALPMCAKESRTDSPAPPSGAADEEGARTALMGTPLGQIISRDAHGKARVILGGLGEDRPTLSVNAETAARVHLLRHAEPLGLNESAVQGATIAATHSIGGGASVIQFEQRIDGIEVFQSRAAVVVDATKNLVSLASNLSIAGSATRATKWDFSLPAEAVMESLYGEHFGVPLASGSVRDTGPVHGGELRGLAVTHPKGAPRVSHATVRRVLFPDAYGLTPAYYVEFFARGSQSRENEAFGYVVSAKDGRIFYKRSLTHSEKFRYRVWAEADQGNIPTDGPYKDYTPNPAGAPQKNVRPEFNDTPPIIEMDGFNAPKDPWLPANATTTSGNNVDAYSDRTDTHGEDADGVPTGEGDGFGEGDVRADTNTSTPRTFDRLYDTAAAPNANQDQIKAAITQLFYVTNWMHDYWYDSGFDEMSGNAQRDNLGRGGVAGDPLLVEAQDGADFGQANNANMSTPADGTSPKMQMYVWSGIANRRLDAAPATEFSDGYGAPAYGPQTYTLPAAASPQAAFVIVNDGTAPTSDACEAIINGAQVNGKIAVIRRSATAGCTLYARTQRAQAAGAIGAIIINNNPPDTHEVVNPSTPDGGGGDIEIPLLTVSSEDGKLLTDKIEAAPGTVTGRMVRGVETLHDGTIDNTVVAHEWGHYLHNRLVTCGRKACDGMSEGWADFNALLMVVREGDTIDGAAYPLSQYATASDAYGSYFGIRRAPYSTDLTKNPFTFKHMQGSAEPPTTATILSGGDMSEVHNVGEIWAQTLFDGYANLQKGAGTFQEKKRRMANHIVAGMKATVVEPSFTEQRDAILAAAWASGQKDDFLALAKGFAKRGMGVGAVSPVAPADPNEDSFEGVVESFDFAKGDLTVADASVTETDSGSCDHDGVLDAGETGAVTIKLRNVGWVALKDSKVTVSSGEPSLTFGSGGSGGEATVASLDPYQDATVKIPVSVAKDAKVKGLVALKITLSNAASVKTSADRMLDAVVNFDEAPNTSATDDVESLATTPAWGLTHAPADLKSWSRRADGTNHVWHGNNSGYSGDESLVSPDLTVGGEDFTISFKHRYAFEYSPAGQVGPDIVYWDGGVLELSEDGGTTWKDVSTYGVDPKYPTTLHKSTSNPLSQRKAWGAVSEGYPAYQTVSLNFAKPLLNAKTVKVRFRIGTDDATGAGGWDIDDVAFTGVTNKPFSTQVAEPTVCTLGADAGQGIPVRYTNSDSACSVSAAAVGSGGAGTQKPGAAAGLGGLLAGLTMLLRRRRHH
ncbi:M36 family metallopeptidase [Pendulispora rubella]|uniref:M36 family metallopeptidase n=1 Tax=Pendulispora rubella TaxID=2741070 RepID=A0ABZ2LHI6_9BACT